MGFLTVQGWLVTSGAILPGGLVEPFYRELRKWMRKLGNQGRSVEEWFRQLTMKVRWREQGDEVRLELRESIRG